MSTLPLFIIGLVVIIGAIILVVVGIKSPQGADPLEDRLAEYAARGETASLEYHRTHRQENGRIRDAVHAAECNYIHDEKAGTGRQSWKCGSSGLLCIAICRHSSWRYISYLGSYSQTGYISGWKRLVIGATGSHIRFLSP